MRLLSDGAEATIRSGLQVQFIFLARNVAGDCRATGGMEAGRLPAFLFCLQVMEILTKIMNMYCYQLLS
jgi:hypothetical protein